MKQQQGMVLVIGLILLSGLAILGISATSSSMLELKVSRNAEVTTDTFQNADAIINSLLNWERSDAGYPFQRLEREGQTRTEVIDNHNVTVTFLKSEEKCENDTLKRILGVDAYRAACKHFDIDINLQQGSKQLQAGSHLVQGAAEVTINAGTMDSLHYSNSDS